MFAKEYMVQTNNNPSFFQSLNSVHTPSVNLDKPAVVYFNLQPFLVAPTPINQDNEDFSHWISSVTDSSHLNSNFMDTFNPNGHQISYREPLVLTNENHLTPLDPFNFNEDAHSVSTSSSVSSKRQSEVNMKINLDPVKRARSEPGTSMDDVIKSGVNLQSLDPHVLRRIKNTDSARKSRLKKQAQVKIMEDALTAQNEEINKLKESAFDLQNQLYDQKLQNQFLKNQYVLMKSLLKAGGIDVPKFFNI